MVTSAALAALATTADGADENSRCVSPELTAAGDPDSTEAGDAGWRVRTAAGLAWPIDPAIATAVTAATEAAASIRAVRPAIRGIPARPALVSSA
jgi:hypothetical protein